uniref:ATP-dependent DNA helicase n=1 Tax=Kalanchoe fedtschenkoi TaxID=63787 RepID=A0A7N0UU60_KALFE
MKSPRSRRNRLARERRARQRALEIEEQHEARRQVRSAVRCAQRARQQVDESLAAVREFGLLIDRQARAVEQEIPLARREIPTAAPTLRYVLHRANVRCRQCEALHWIEERVRAIGSTLANPQFSVCCDRGKVANIPSLAQPPEPLRSLLQDQTPVARAFRTNIRAYNSALSFTSLGAKLDERFTHGGVYTFRIQGALYHRMGSLLPEAGHERKFAQLYIAENSTALAGRLNIFPTLDRQVLGDLQSMLQMHNPYMQLYEQVRQQMEDNQVVDLELRLLCLQSNDRRRYNTPIANEIGAIMVGDGYDGSTCDRDIILKCRDGCLQRISALHSAYTPLHYVLLFPDGRQGWTPTMPLRGFEYDTHRRQFHENEEDIVCGKGGSKRVSQMQYYSYMLHPRAPGEHLFLSGRLLQQYVVDAWACTEQNRLQYIAEHQGDLRCELYSGVMDAINEGDHDAAQVVRKMILPSTFAAGDRQMSQLYQDAMAIVRKCGRPDLFVTFTCNPKWPDITAELEPGQTSPDWPDLVARVFNIKFQELMRDLMDRKIFGTVAGKVWVIEFQKRADDIDSVVSAEIPDPVTHPDAYETVTRCLVHGPCGAENPNASCMQDGKCTKRYPRAFANKTYADTDGYPVYRRRDGDHSFVDAKGRRVDNHWIVLHNLYLSCKYDAHINVEICSSISAIKYLFKYVYKGHDRTTAVIENENEIKQYIDARYVSAPEACWRLIGFKMHDHLPPVQRLQVHLPDQQQIVFNAGGDLPDAVNNDRARKTALMEWFDANCMSAFARGTTYLDFPSCFVWNDSRKKWSFRKRGMGIGRLYFVSHKAGEHYFLRTLLRTVKGATSFANLRTYNGVEHETFKAACAARGLYENDDEWRQCLHESSLMQSGAQLRSLFVTILIHGPPSEPRQLWDEFRNDLSDDCANRLRQGGNDEPSVEQITSLALTLIMQLLLPFERRLADFNLPEPAFHMYELQGNRFIAEQLAFDADALRRESDRDVQSLNAEQLDAYRQVMWACDHGDGGIFFVDGPGGTGKTYLENLMLKSVRGQRKVAIAVASSGIAALLLSKGRTAHSRFKIPIDLKSNAVCSISKQSELAEMIRHATLILWDEAPMMSKFAFESVDRTLRDITNRPDSPFGRITFVMCGDFRQVLPVVPKGLRPDVVAASIKESYLWMHVRLCRLRENMRASNDDKIADLGDRTFADWLLALGEDRLEKVETDCVTCPESMVVNDHTLNGLINSIYGDVADAGRNARAYFSHRAILAARNDNVAEINTDVLNKIPREVHEFLSADKVDDEEGANLLPTEFLNRLDVNGWPPHKLLLKVGTPIMLLRNLDPANGLCNGTRLIVRRCSARVIEAEVLVGDHAGHVCFIPWIALISEQSGLPFAVRRKQFPVRLAYAMIINKSQGQTLHRIGICLARGVFSHGQLYVAFSRATTPENVSVLLEDESAESRLMHNVVYDEALR